MMSITIGFIIRASNMPNLNHRRFRGSRIFGMITATVRNTPAMHSDHMRTGLSPIKGHRPIIRKTTKKTIPNERFEPTSTSEWSFVSIIFVSSLMNVNGCRKFAVCCARIVIMLLLISVNNVKYQGQISEYYNHMFRFSVKVTG